MSCESIINSATQFYCTVWVTWSRVVLDDYSRHPVMYLPLSEKVNDFFCGGLAMLHVMIQHIEAIILPSLKTEMISICTNVCTMRQEWLRNNGNVPKTILRIAEIKVADPFVGGRNLSRWRSAWCIYRKLLSQPKLIWLNRFQKICINRNSEREATDTVSIIGYLDIPQLLALDIVGKVLKMQINAQHSKMNVCYHIN